MKTIFPIRQLALILTALYGQSVLANRIEQCRVGIPTWDRPLITGDPNELPVLIHARKVQTHYPNNVLFDGHTIIEQGNTVLSADQVILNQTQKWGQTIPTRTVIATGGVQYRDPLITLQGSQAWSDLNNKDTDMDQGNYQLTGRQGRGDANKMQLRGANRYTILKKGTFTSCLPGDNSWSLKGSDIIHDREEQLVEIWHARFRLGNIPVFYSPYLQLPVGDRRRSGLLIPSYRYSGTNSFEFLQPWYWNIAPNYDATITPHWIMKRGLQWQNEFRYLTSPGAGTLAFDWLNEDNEYAKTYPDNSRRWLTHWNHEGVMDHVWRFNIDYTRVSDVKYFTDLTSSYGTTTDGYITQKFSLGYAERNWNATLTSRQFQIFAGGTSTGAYRAQPELNLNYYKNDLGPFDSHVYGQAVKFTNVNPAYPDASRWHIQPAINLPLANDWASFNTSVQLLATHYQQDIPSSSAAGNDRLHNTINRVMPKFKTDSTIIFERDMDWVENYMQTLEPRVQYLYIPYRNQDDIYLYDSTLLQSDYFGLFRDNAYGGLDRISSANQLTTGLTSRIYDEALVERFNLSAGQIYYFTPAHTGHKNVLDLSKNRGSLAWAGDSYWKINEYLGLRGGVQYDTRLNSLTLGNGIIEYRQNMDRMLQLNYRYANSEYIQAILNKNYIAGAKPPDYQKGISQAGMTASWPVMDRWSVAGAYYYDTKAWQPASRLIGLQYNTCCWAIKMNFERKIIGWDTANIASQYDNKWSFNVELRGLNNDHNPGASGLLGTGIFPYQHAF